MNNQQHLDAVIISTQLTLATIALNITRILRDEERVVKYHEIAFAAHHKAVRHLEASSLAKEDVESLLEELRDLGEKVAGVRFSPRVSGSS